MIFVDSNVILDLWTNSPVWLEWSKTQLQELSRIERLVINPIVYAEISVVFSAPSHLDARLSELEVEVLDLSQAVAFLAGKAFVQYKRRGGAKTNALADFFIGAHAAVLGCALLTRDKRRYATYFPQVQLITP